MKTFLFLLPLALLLSPSAHASPVNCTDRDYRGLELDSRNPPMINETICQLKLILKNRTNHDSLRLLVDLNSDLIGFDSKELTWDKPLVGVINELINGSLEDKNLNKLAQACRKFFLDQNKYNLDDHEIKMLELLSVMEIQHGGQK